MTASQMPSLRDRYAALIASDEQLRAMVPSPEVWATASAVEGPVERRIDAVLEGYADRPAIAERSYTLEFEPVVDADAVARPPSRTGTVARHYLPEYSTVSFGDLRRRIRDIASAWRFDPDFAVGRDELVCMIGFASVDYAAIDLACAYAQVVSVPLQSTTSGADLDEILDRVNPAALAASIDDLAVAAEQAVRHGGIRTLIAFDYDAGAEDEWARFEAAREILERGGVATRLIALDDLAAIGRRHEWTFLPAHPDGPDRLMVIVHSSGSTGTPKGAMVTERQIADWWNASRDKFPDVIVLFAPLNHGMGRVQLHMQLRKGCLTYITLKPDMSTLFEDIRLARPTTLGFFPRVLDLVYQSFRNDVARRVRSGESEEQAQREVMAGMRHSFLGDRLLHAGVGSAPTSPEVKDFMVDCFQIRLNEGYANTETGSGAVTMNNIVNRSIVLDYRLRDVPELGYYTSDRPYPRGELCFKGKFQIKGYYKDPEATAGLLTDDGFIITGDIVEQRGPDELVLIDRRKDVIKLSQGEFVAVGPLGATFEAAIPVIHQMYIYGNSHRSYLLAVVVPDQEAVTAELGESPTDQQIKDLVRAELRRVAEEHQLKTFEVPRDFIIEHEPFSQENGLLSSVRKRLRPALQRRYGEQLKAIYEAHDAAVRDELHALKDPASELSIPERLTKLVQISLGLDHLALDSPYTFAELGGDSLGAVELSVAIEETFGVVVPADGILGPTGTLQRIATEITSLVSDDFDRPTFERVHGHDPELLHVKDLALDRFIDAKTLSAAATLPAASDPAEVVLVTGANGFLGREVCLQWMERVAPLGGRVVCLIRASDDAAAAQRLTQAFTDASPEYLDRFLALAANHLEVVAGDVGLPNLGLDSGTFARLATEVARICHVAALVNHRLGYIHLFGPNVAGTAEIIRLAVTGTRKPVDFVSTMGVLPFLDPATGNNENARPVESVRMIDDHYAGGYAISKWASEHLVHAAREELGVPVTILRGPMMLPHQQTPGVINTGDMFTRLLYSIIVTGIAPRSFYRQKDGGSTPGHYNAVPVDVVAASVVGATSVPADGDPGVNMSNYHVDDGCSLDAFVDWIESAGYPVERIDQYSEWYDRFQEKLEALPAEKKGASAFEVLGAYAVPHNPRADAAIVCDQYRDLVRRVVGDVPHLDETYIHKCLADLRFLGLVGDPQRA